jgi:hypothetical protein
LLVSKRDEELLGATEFAVRDRVHAIGALALETALNERKKSPPGGGTGPSGREGAAAAMAGPAGRLGAGAVGVPGQDLGEHEHDPALRPLPHRAAVGLPRPHGHRKTTTFVVALRSEGLTAPTVIDGAMTGDLFVAYVEPTQ